MPRADLNGLRVGFSELLPIGSGNRNEPCIVPDPDAGGYVLFYSTPTTSNTWYWRTATDPAGTWGSENTGSTTGQKPYIVQDLDGNPVKLNVGVLGTVYCCLVLTNSRLDMTLFTASTLTGTWTNRGAVFSANGGAAEASLLAISMVSNSGTLHLYYSAEPSSSNGTYGWGSRGFYATASAIDGSYARVGAILNNSTNGADWDYGWIGGMQVVNRPAGGYVMVYNASNTRPVGAAGEPDVSLIGFATASSLAGPWTKATSNPVPIPTTYTGIAPVEVTNLWRAFLFYDTTNSRWEIWCNTGAFGTEVVTYAVLGVGSYNWTQDVDDNFNRANGAVGNNWTVINGNFQISSNTVHNTVTDAMYRASGETAINQRIDWRFTWPSGANVAILAEVRVLNTTEASRTCYQAGFFGNGTGTFTMDFKRCASGTESSSLGSFSVTVTAGNDVELQLAAREKADGTTNLYASFINHTTAGQQINPSSPVNDSNGTFHSGGHPLTGRTGIRVFDSTSQLVVLTHATTWLLTQTGGITLNLGTIPQPSLMLLGMGA